ncbi:major facilitator superfamily domain-containing protein 8 isoform X2 [Acanthochromis polyacanthus]|uniref:major facilitator superfamily domain-containing protein 8 isoform X2 n=1 Tax=Acanthochromis polyacanthus TaxID=80966 RepID=UPI000B8F08B2|nr:major facilitator superfamily domain-containing protein 8 isoform X2 [Acanthochromis polyacanthus]
MDNRRKKRLTYFTTGLIFLLSGVEYAVILPTIWRYLQTLDAEPYFLGLTLSAFSLSGLLSGPLFGHWSDRRRAIKKIILFGNLFEIVGNLMYFMGYSKWLLLSSRFVAGPAFNIFLRLSDFHVGPFLVDKYTSPGLFMCLMWTLLQPVVVFMYWDLPPIENVKAKNRLINSNEEKTEQELVKDEDESNEEEKPLMSSQEMVGSYGSVVRSSPLKNHTSPASNGTMNHISTPPSPMPPETNKSSFFTCSMMREFLKEEVVVLLAAQFITLFNQTALETMVTPLTQKYFNFGELENSVMYCLAGGVVIAGFLFVRWLSRHVAERVVLVIGLSIANISCIWCLIFLANPRGDYPWQLTEFIIGIFLQVVGLPFVAVSQVSLFSKITSEKTQGFSQGVRRSVGGLATILGPLWAGGLTENMYIMMGVMMGLLVMLSVMVAFSYNQLVEPAVEEELDCLENEDSTCRQSTEEQ